jgi:hypothetical protein
MRYLLSFYAREDEWIALPASERDAGIAEIGRWFAEHAKAGKDLPVVSDGPFAETKETVGSYAVVQVADEAEAVAIAKAWPAGGIVEVRPLAD